MKKLITLYVFLVLLYSCGTSKSVLSADKAVIETTIDLVNVNDDRVSVTINPGSFSKQSISFFIPKRFPGLIVRMTMASIFRSLRLLIIRVMNFWLLLSEPMNGISPMQRN